MLSGHDHVYLRTYMMDGEKKSLGIINSKISIIISIGALILAASVTIVFFLFKKKKRK